MLIQQLFTGIEDEKCRESLLNEDASYLTWEKHALLFVIKRLLSLNPMVLMKV